MQMKRVSLAEMAKQLRLVFLCGPEMWMFTVGRGLITFLQQLKSIGPPKGTYKTVRKAYCDNGPHCVGVDSFGTLRRVEMCGILKKNAVEDREGEKVERNQINRSE